MLVVDCSAAVAMVQGTPHGKALRALTLTGEEMVAPDILPYELANVAWKMTHADTATGKEARQLVEDCLALVDTLYDAKPLLAEVLHESRRLDHPAYDIFYLVLARRLDACLLTLDKPLIRLCVENGIDVVQEIAV